MAKRAGILSLKAGDLVLVEPDLGDPAVTSKQGWWMGQVIWAEGNSRNPAAPSQYQAANVDTGEVVWINADQATRLVIDNYQPEETDVFTVELQLAAKVKNKLKKRFI